MCILNTLKSNKINNCYHTKINSILSELLQKLESEHGISPDQGNSIVNTIVQHTVSTPAASSNAANCPAIPLTWNKSE